VNKYWIDITAMTKELIEKNILPNIDKNDRLYKYKTPTPFMQEIANKGLISEKIFSRFKYYNQLKIK